MAFHHCQMDRITRRQSLGSHHNFLGALYCGTINAQYFIGNAQERVECRLDCITAIDCYVAVQYFLENFRICNQPLSVANERFN